QPQNAARSTYFAPTWVDAFITNKEQDR
ncbi:MAG: hypothetical protein JWQ18_2751, partial [Conexibacter sp.]|nr:hypothetical protein [Conexibacter sp.]